MKQRTKSRNSSSSSHPPQDGELLPVEMDSVKDKSIFKKGDFVWDVSPDSTDDPKMCQIISDDNTKKHFRVSDNGELFYFVKIVKSLESPGRWVLSKYLLINNKESHCTIAKEAKRKLEKEASEAEKSSHPSTNSTEHDPQNVGGHNTQVNGNAGTKEVKSKTLVAKESSKAKNSSSSAASTSSSQSSDNAVTSKKETRNRRSRAKKTSLKVEQSFAETTEKESVAADLSNSVADLDTSATNLNDLPLSKLAPESFAEALSVTTKKQRQSILDHPFTKAQLDQAWHFMKSIEGTRARKTDDWHTMHEMTGLTRRSLIRYSAALNGLVKEYDKFRTETKFGLSLERFIVLTKHCLDRVNGVPLPKTPKAKMENKETTGKKQSSFKKVKMAENKEASGDYLDKAYTNGNGSSETADNSDPSTSSASNSQEVQSEVVSSQVMDIAHDATPVKTNGFTEHSATETSMDVSVNLNGSLHQDDSVNENRRENIQKDAVNVSSGRIKRPTRKKREMYISPEADHSNNGWSDKKFQVNGDNEDGEKPAPKQSKLVKESSKVVSSYPDQSDSVSSSSQSFVKELVTASAAPTRRKITTSRKLSKRTAVKKRSLSCVTKDSIEFRVSEGRMTYSDVKKVLLDCEKFRNFSKVALEYGVETGILRKCLTDYLSKVQCEHITSDLVEFQPIKEQLIKILQYHSYHGWNVNIKDVLQLANELLKESCSESVRITESAMMDFCLMNNIYGDSWMFLEQTGVLSRCVATIQKQRDRLNIDLTFKDYSRKGTIIAWQFELPPPIDFPHRIFLDIAMNGGGYVFNPLVTFVGPGLTQLSKVKSSLIRGDEVDTVVNVTSLRSMSEKKILYFNKILNYYNCPKFVVYDGLFELNLADYKNLKIKLDQHSVIRSPNYDPEYGTTKNSNSLQVWPRLLQRHFFSHLENCTRHPGQIIKCATDLAAKLRKEFFCFETILETFKNQGMFPADIQKAIEFDMEATEKDLVNKYQLPELPEGWQGGLRLSEEKKRELVGLSSGNNLEEVTSTSIETDPHTTTLKNTVSGSSSVTFSTDVQTRGLSESNEQLTNFSSGNLNKDGQGEMNKSKGNVLTRQTGLSNQEISKGIMHKNFTRKKNGNFSRKRIRQLEVHSNVSQPVELKRAKQILKKKKSKRFLPTKSMIEALKLAIVDVKIVEIRDRLPDALNPVIDDSIDTEKTLNPVRRPACIRCHRVSTNTHDFANHWRFCSQGNDEMTDSMTLEDLMKIESKATEFDISTPDCEIWKCVEKFFNDLDEGQNLTSINPDWYQLLFRDVFYSPGLLSNICGSPLGDQLNEVIKKMCEANPDATSMLIQKKQFSEDFTPEMVEQTRQITKRVVNAFKARHFVEARLKLKLPVVNVLPAVKDVAEIESDQESTTNAASRKSASKSKQLPKPSTDLSVESDDEEVVSEEESCLSIDSESDSSSDDDDNFVKLPMNFNAVIGFGTQHTVTSGTKLQICWVCKSVGDVKRLMACSGACSQYYHPECLGLKKIDPPFKCIDCKNNTIKCIHCNKATADDGSNEFAMCQKMECKRIYHISCKTRKADAILEATQQHGHQITTKLRTNISGEASGCLTHICYTCHGSEESGKRLSASKNWASNSRRTLRCIFCSASYHNERRCVPAAAVVIGGLHIICPLHLTSNQENVQRNTVHMDACLDCKDGGELLFCDLCPAAAHEQCSVMRKKNMFGVKADKWFCESCSFARKPIVGDIVFCFTDHYQWWPAEVIDPKYTPQDILMKENQESEFCLHFLGSETHGWRDQKHCLPFAIGYSYVLHKRNQKSHFKQSLINGCYKKGLAKAKELHDALKKVGYSVPCLDDLRKPGPYLWTDVPLPYKNTKLPHEPHCSNTCRCTEESFCHADADGSAHNGCLNAMASIECPEDCPSAGEYCKNQELHNHVYPQCYVREFRGKGYGLCAAEPIKSGTFIGEYTGEVIDETEMKRREDLNENGMFYYFELEHKIFIDANSSGNHTRFMNHSCAANCTTKKWIINKEGSESGCCRMKISAHRDIEKGEELTFSYNNVAVMKEVCRCGEDVCVSQQKRQSSSETESSVPPSPKPQKSKKRRRTGYNDCNGKRRKTSLISDIGVEKSPAEIPVCIMCQKFKKPTEECSKCKRRLCRECVKKYHQPQKPNTEPVCPCYKCANEQCKGRRVDSCSFCMMTSCTLHSKFTYSKGVHLRICPEHNPDTIEQEFADRVATGYNATFKLKALDKMKATLKPYGQIELSSRNGTVKTIHIKSFYPLSKTPTLTKENNNNSRPSTSGAQKRNRSKNFDESPATKIEKPTPKRARLSKETRRTTPAAPKLKASTSGVSKVKRPSTPTPVRDESSDFKTTKLRSTSRKR